MRSAMGARARDIDTVGGRIQYYRIQNGWSRQHLANRIGVSASCVTNHERGYSGWNPRPDTVRRFAAALGRTPKEIDPDYVEKIEFQSNGNDEYRVVNAYEDTLEKFGIDRTSRYDMHDLTTIIARIGRAGYTAVIHGLNDDN